MRYLRGLLGGNTFLRKMPLKTSALEAVSGEREDRMQKNTISVMVGKGSLNHNSRVFYAENVDPSRSHLNIEYCNENIKDVYHELFDDALARYNAKQKRSDRKIENYYEKICSGKQEKPFHELVIQIGNRDTCAAATEDGAFAARLLDEYMRGFQKRNPTLRVFSAHLHMDEATPHLHIDFVPYTTGSKRGLDTRVSLKKALEALGFKGGTRSDTEWDQWANAEKERLAEIMLAHGVEWEKKGTHEEHLSVLDYKKKERTKEVELLERQKENIKRTTEAQLKASAQLHMELSQANHELTALRRETADAREEKEDALQAVATAKKEAEEAEAIVEENQKKANGLKGYIQTFERNVHEYDDAKKWQLPEPDFLMGAGTYREKKALPLVNKLKNVIKNLTLQLIHALEANDRLKQSLKKSDQKADRLLNRISSLEERNNILDERSHRLELVEHAVGEDQVNRIADEQSRREEWEKKQRKRQRNRTEWTL